MPARKLSARNEASSSSVAAAAAAVPSGGVSYVVACIPPRTEEVWQEDLSWNEAAPIATATDEREVVMPFFDDSVDGIDSDDL